MNPSNFGAFMVPARLWRTHDLSGIGLSAQTADNAQHDESHRALGYEGQGLA
jgi:hypothetical protein